MIKGQEGGSRENILTLDGACKARGFQGLFRPIITPRPRPGMIRGRFKRGLCLPRWPR